VNPYEFVKHLQAAGIAVRLLTSLLNL